MEFNCNIDNTTFQFFSFQEEIHNITAIQNHLNTVNIVDSVLNNLSAAVAQE